MVGFLDFPSELSAGKNTGLAIIQKPFPSEQYVLDINMN